MTLPQTDPAASPDAIDPGARAAASAPIGNLVSPRLPWPRLVLAVAGGAVAVAGSCLAGPATPLGWFELSILTLATVAMPINRVDVHVLVRAALWGAMTVGGVATAFSDATSSVMTLAGAAVALLALGRAGLDRARGAFSPRVLRGSLVAMMVVALSIAHVYLVLGLGLLSQEAHLWTAPPFGPGAGPAAVLLASLVAAPLGLLVGVVGLSRTRAWGLFGYLAGLFASVMVVLVAALGDFVVVGYIPIDWVLTVIYGAGGALLLGTGLPVLSALVWPRAPRPEGRPWTVIAHSALVVVVVLGAFAGRALLP